MNSQIYIGQLMHSRLEPVQHKFVYPFYFYSFDLSELSQLARSLNLFGYNKIKPVAIHDRDYLGDGQGSIKTKLMSFLNKKGCGDGIDSIKLVTVARHFNYIFNPVSFFYCYRSDGELRCIVSEINNTYGETHLYILDRSLEPRPNFLTRYRLPKEFFVSPFNDLTGDYEFHFSEIDRDLDIQIEILRENRKVFLSRMWGKGIPLNSTNLIRTLIQYPFSASLAMPRITWQALILKYQKGLKTYLKPKPTSTMTIRTAKPSFYQRLYRSIILSKYKIFNQFRNVKK
ncbi:MAG: DUF1365 domain-containing protein [Prochloraceae cyanobacterium]|nr:DUF1365 domain-containing protein [Prochloraceae cyanobacterium]